MPAPYFSLLTDGGAALLAAALDNGTPVTLTEMAVGSGQNGAPYDPDGAETALKGETYRAALNRLTVDPGNPNWLVAELVIPPSTGGWTIREAGVFTDGGDLFAIAKLPETYKSVLAEGTASELMIRLILEVTNAGPVTLLIDPSVVLATRQYVDDAVAAVQVGPATTTQQGIVELATQGEAKAGSDATRAVTPAGLAAVLADPASAAFLPLAGGTLTGALSIDGPLIQQLRLLAGDPGGGENRRASLDLDDSDGTRRASLAWNSDFDRFTITLWNPGNTAGPTLTINQDATLFFVGQKVWHEGSDGAGSGLDADLLQGRLPSALGPQPGTIVQRGAEGGVNAGAVMRIAADGNGVSILRLRRDDDATLGATLHFDQAAQQSAWALYDPLGVSVVASLALKQDGTATLNGQPLVTDAGNDLSGNGYQVFSSGLIMQWGTVSVGPNTVETVTLPVAFTTAAFAAFCAQPAITTNDQEFQGGAQPLGLTQVQVANDHHITHTMSYLVLGR